ncbi:MAG: hypothetical protein WCG67_10710, partial [Ferruginibacter sp.]
IFNSLTQALFAMHNFTPEDLIQYLYKETSLTQSAAISAALESDWSLREKFEELTSAQNELKSLQFSPSRQTIDNILKYAEKTMSELSV